MTPRLANHVIFKISARCNLDCGYCHWFRDESVMALPKQVGGRVRADFLRRLEEHLSATPGSRITVVLHGGEPLLLGRSAFEHLCVGLREVELRTGAQVEIAVTTNGVLIDENWAALFKAFRVSPCVSLDGPEDVHDRHRLDLRGRATHADAVKGIRILQRAGFDALSVLAVCDPTASARSYLEAIVDDLNVRSLDVLIPNVNHDDAAVAPVPSIAQFYCDLFDLWYSDYATRGVRIRCAEAMASAVLGGRVALAGLGRTALSTITVRSDGGIEPHDVLRIGGREQVETGLNVRSDPFSSLLENDIWLETYRMSLSLPEDCKGCSFSKSCGGGYLIHRFSTERRYDNPSVYCKDIKKILSHVEQHITDDLLVIDRDISASNIPLSTNSTPSPSPAP